MKRIKTQLRKLNEIPLNVRVVIGYFFCSLVQRGVSVLATPIFTRLMTTEEYGNYNIFYSWFEIFGVFVSLRIFYGCYSQGIVKFEADKERFTASLQGLSFSLVAVWLILVRLFERPLVLLTKLSPVHLYLMLILIWTSGVFSYWSTYQRTQMRVRALIILTIVAAFFKQAAGILAVMGMEDRVTGRILSWALVEVILFSGLFISQVWRGKSFFHGKYWKYAICFATPLIPHYLSQTILASSDRIMIERMAGSDAAGIYSLGYMISLGMQIVNTALIHTLEPTVYRKIRDGKAQELRSLGILSMEVVAAVDLLLIAVAPELVRLFAPEAYSEAVDIIAPVTISVFIMYMYTLFAEFEFYYEKKWTITLTTSLAAILNIVLNAVCIPRFGWKAAAYTTLISYLCYTFLHYRMMCRICRQEIKVKPVYPLADVLGLTVLALAMALVLHLLYPWFWARLSLLLAAALLLFLKREAILRKGKELFSRK
ncbi:MAG: oligosaccharide flippase family protein [Clostridia bacterium]|nr:oligosaccharide flippase family protein [Clostridia bacterium]